MHSDITKEDIEHSRHFPVIVVLYLPYTREVDYKRLNRTVTPMIYHMIWKYRVQSQVNTV
jgi:hypothetical protein